MIGEHARRARPLERQQGLEHERVAVAGPGRRGSLDHRIFAAHLISEDRDFEASFTRATMSR